MSRPSSRSNLERWRGDPAAFKPGFSSRFTQRYWSMTQTQPATREVVPNPYSFRIPELTFQLPCAKCSQWEDDHAEGKCLFGPGKYRQMSFQSAADQFATYRFKEAPGAPGWVRNYNYGYWTLHES